MNIWMCGFSFFRFLRGGFMVFDGWLVIFIYFIVIYGFCDRIYLVRCFFRSSVI